MAERVTQVPAIISAGGTANERVTQFSIVTSTAETGAKARLTQLGAVTSTAEPGAKARVTQAGVVVSAKSTGLGRATQVAVIVCVPAGASIRKQPNICVIT